MIIFKTSAETLPQVLKHAKHAVNNPPIHATSGELLLVSQTITSLRSGQKSIRWVMTYRGCYQDTDRESQKLWGRDWDYIVVADNVRAVEPFNIKDIQKTSKNYGAAVNYSYVESDDEKEVLRVIDPATLPEIDERVRELEELELEKHTTDDINLLDALNKKYVELPDYVDAITRRLNRPTAVRDAVLERDGTQCRICGAEGFLKAGGGRYAEVHHMIEIDNRAPRLMDRSNVIVVCPTCHRMLHYGDVQVDFLNPGWKIRIGPSEYQIR